MHKPSSKHSTPCCAHYNWSRSSSVSIVSNYELDDRAIAGRGKGFFLCVQNGSDAHPAFCTMGAGGPFPGAKRGRSVTLTIHPHLVPRSRMSRSYTSSPPSATMACSGTALLCLRALYFQMSDINKKFWEELIRLLSLHKFFI
jgi:hypothetical protein